MHQHLTIYRNPTSPHWLSVIHHHISTIWLGYYIITAKIGSFPLIARLFFIFFKKISLSHNIFYRLFQTHSFLNSAQNHKIPFILSILIRILLIFQSIWINCCVLAYLTNLIRLRTDFFRQASPQLWMKCSVQKRRSNDL